ncbi:MAG TPA: filamentous hemagglutinin N-terminal domain-containing protein [Myxococcota bacterium]|nr:filamentous hemagglutinin N-terminal domain-containing protein [Myxococcota bacterium]
MSRRPRMLRSCAARALAASLFVGLSVAPPGLPSAFAAPKGEKVVRGKASFVRDGDLTVIRPSNGAIIEFTGFDILRNEAVRFEQPSSKSRVLNRVSGPASLIEGKLSANGIVYIMNPSGVFFGRTAVVDVKGLMAAGGDLSNRDFARGIDRIDLSGPVENHGTLRASAVKLLGTSVANGGEIVTPDGVIALVAGDHVVLTKLEGGIAIEVDGPPEGGQTGIEQSGLVDAGMGSASFAVGDHYSLAINHSGVTRARDIDLSGGDGGLVRVAGTLDASNAAAGAKGGTIRATGDLVSLEGATLDASGAAGGGEIRVGGDVRGAGPMPDARRTFVDAQSTLRADALDEGNGGSAVVYGTEAAGFLGTISARGGAAGGNGGFAELSSGGRLVDEGSKDLSAPHGAAGTILFDPQDIVIVGGTQDGGDQPNTAPDQLSQTTAGQILFADVGSSGEPFQVFESELEGTNANIVLEARNSITASGTFDHDAGGEGAGVVVIQSGNDLTMRTSNQAGEETGSTKAPGIDLTGSTHGANLEFRTTGDGLISIATGTGTNDGPEAPIAVGVLRTDGRVVGLQTEDGGITANRITTAGASGATGADGGDIVLQAGDKNGSGGSAILVSGDLVTRGGDGTSGAGGNGGVISLVTRPKPALPPPVGGGSITVLGNITTRGGDSQGTRDTSVGGTGGRVNLGSTNGDVVFQNVDTSGGNTAGGKEASGGGAAGFVIATADQQGSITTGDITSRGGDASSANASDGGFGGTVGMRTLHGDITVGAIDTSGGATNGNNVDLSDPMKPKPLEFGGTAGEVQMLAGSDTGGTGSIHLNGNMVLLGGSKGTGPESGEGLGGGAELRAHDSIEHGGQAGPHITTQGSVIFNAANVGAVSPIVVSGRRDASDPSPTGLLGLGADTLARVVVDEGTFNDFQVVAFGTGADLQVVEGASQIIRIQNAQLVQADTTAHGPDLTVGLQDRLDGTNDVHDDGALLAFTLQTGSLHAGGNARVVSEGDIVVGTSPGTVATMQELPIDPAHPNDPRVSGSLLLNADSDRDASTAHPNGGAIRDGVAGAAGGELVLYQPLPVNGTPGTAGGLAAVASQDIGLQGDPIVTVGSSRVAAQSLQSGGVFLRNDGAAGDTLTVGAVSQGGNLVGSGVSTAAGAGNIELENTVGNLVLERSVQTSGDTSHNGGNVTLRVPSGSHIVFNSPPAIFDADANGKLTFDGDVTLMQDSRVRSRQGNVEFDGAIDTDSDPTLVNRVRSLGVVACDAKESCTRAPGTKGDIQISHDIGVTKDLRGLVFDGNVVLSGGARSIVTTNLLSFLGDVNADGTDSASLDIQAGPRVDFNGDVGTGANGRLARLSIARNSDPPFTVELPDPLVVFGGDAAQTVQTGAGGIAFTPAGLTQIPDRAKVAKRNGDLTLTSSGGTIDFGLNQKLTVQGTATIDADHVLLGDVSALGLNVTSPDAKVRARAPGKVLLQVGGTVEDQGTDIIANTVSFSSDVGVEGTGPTPRIATQSGHADGAGTLPVRTLPNPVQTSDLTRGRNLSTVLDLTLLPTELPNETPQRGPTVSEIVPLRRGDQSAAGSALPPGAEVTLAYLRCTAESRGDCPVAPGSPLDSPRGRQLAADSARLLGGSPEARDLRAALARLDPSALRELAVFLTEVRLLGLSEAEYQSVRDSLYREILADHGPDAPDARAFARAVESQARGVPL